MFPVRESRKGKECWFLRDRVGEGEGESELTLESLVVERELGCGGRAWL